MARDSQKSKVYRAEYRAKLQSDRLETVAEMQEFVDFIITSRWWKSRTSIKRIKVMPGRGCRSALKTYTKWGWPAIKMPRWSRSKHVILHELTHHMTPDEYASHGREFCRSYLAMIKRWLGHEQWRRLHHEFHNLNVKHHKAPNLSTERRAALATAARERFGIKT